MRTQGAYCHRNFVPYVKSISSKHHRETLGSVTAVGVAWLLSIGTYWMK